MDLHQKSVAKAERTERVHETVQEIKPASIHPIANPKSKATAVATPDKGGSSFWETAGEIAFSAVPFSGVIDMYKGARDGDWMEFGIVLFLLALISLLWEEEV